MSNLVLKPSTRAFLIVLALLALFLGVAAFPASHLPELAVSDPAPPSTEPRPSPLPPTSRPRSVVRDLPPTSEPTPPHASAPSPTPVPEPTYPPPPDQVEVPILMYHYVEQLPPGADAYRRDLTVTPENFRAQLDLLSTAGYHTITLDDLYLHLTTGRPLPEKPIILTFDDGYRDAYDMVFPMLQEHDFVGTFFVLSTPAHYESPQYLTWDMMQEMTDAGMAIQGHGRDHVDLRNRSYDFLVYQTLGIKEAIEYHTDQPVHFFCYPSGQYDDGVIAVLESAGYWGAVSTRHERVHTRDDLLTLGRIRIRGGDSLETFIDKVEGNY